VREVVLAEMEMGGRAKFGDLVRYMYKYRKIGLDLSLTKELCGENRKWPAGLTCAEENQNKRLAEETRKCRLGSGKRDPRPPRMCPAWHTTWNVWDSISVHHFRTCGIELTQNQSSR
jgi:hypothetical protein